MPPIPERELFTRFAGSVAYINVIKPDGDPGIGTCFHIGDGIFLTARHVVEGNIVTKIANTPAGVREDREGYYAEYLVGQATSISEPFYHSDQRYDIAAIKTEGITCRAITVGPITPDPFGNVQIMRPVVIMGFPRVYLSSEPVLVCALGQINAVINTYINQQRMYVISCLARGGFSGGPVLYPPDYTMGVITDSLVNDNLPAELGFMGVVPCLPIYELLSQHNIMPVDYEQHWLEYLSLPPPVPIYDTRNRQ